MANNSFVIDRSLSFRKLAVAPSSPNLWEIYDDLTQNILLQWNGTVWVPFGGSGTGGSKNYFTGYLDNMGNGNFELGTTAGWSLAHSTLTTFIPTSVATPGIGFDSTHGGTSAAGTLSFTTISVGQLSGLFSGSLDSTVASTAGDMLISAPFTIDKSDQSQSLDFSFSYEDVSGTMNFSGTSANTFSIWIYDVTNGAWIQPVGVYNMIQASGVGTASGVFTTTSNSTQYQLALININATPGAYDLYVDNFTLGPSTTGISGGVLNPTITVLTSGTSATYFPPVGVSYLRVRMVGGGSGGGGLSPSLAAGNTIFGLSTAGGALGGTGGVSTLGSGFSGIAYTGGGGGASEANSAAVDIAGQLGASSPFGGAGAGGAGANGPGSNAVANSGSGGGGGSVSNGGNGGFSGSAGGYIDAIITSPLSSYVFTIGLGSVGTAGNSFVGAGGNGASGIIVIEEHYSTSGGSGGIEGLNDDVGTIFSSGTSIVPIGALLCDGSAVSRSTYAALFQKIGTNYGVGNGSTTFNLPNGQGVFLRGNGTQTIGGGVYTGTLGAFQADEFQGHYHATPVTYIAAAGASSFSAGAGIGTSTSTYDPTTDGANGTPRIGPETRPANIGVVWYIRYAQSGSSGGISVPQTSSMSYGLTTPQSVTANAILKYDTVIADRNFLYSPSTGLTTIQVVGEYTISIVTINSTGTSTMYVKKNGTGAGYLCTSSNSTLYSGTISLPLLAGDTIGIYTDTTETFTGPSTQGYANSVAIQRVSN